MRYQFSSYSGFVFVLCYYSLIQTKNGKISVGEVVGVINSFLKSAEDVIATDWAFDIIKNASSK